MSDFMLENKEIQLLEILHKRDYSSLDFLAETIGVGTRTIRNYIKNINKYLNGIVKIENKRGKGFWLSIEDTIGFHDLQQKILSQKNVIDTPKNRIAHIIERLLDHDRYYTLDELADEMNLGRTTLINELKRASQTLETYHLKISGKPNQGMHLSGSEINLRFFILDNVYDALYGSYPIDEDLRYEIEKMATKYDFESNTKKRFFEFVVVMLDRFLKGYPLETVKENHLKLFQSNDYQIGLEMTRIIEEKLPVNIPEYEALFLAIPVAGRRTPTNNRTTTEVKITDDVTKLLEMIIEEIGFRVDIIEENKAFFKDLQYHLTFMLNRLSFQMRLENPMLADVKEKYPVAFEMAKIAGRVIEREYEIYVSEDELGYIAFYFGVFISQSELKLNRLKKAAVICGTGRGTAKLVATQLRRILNQETKLDLYSENELTKDILDTYDILFSTIELPFETSTPTLIINEIFDEQTLSKKIEKVAYMQHLHPLKESSHNSIISLLINKDKFFILDSEKGYQQNVYEMVDQLIHNNYLDEGFKDRLKKRAEKGSMIYDRFISLPHTFNYQSDHIELAIGVFPERVEADGKEIGLVFLLGLPEKHSVSMEYQLVKVYEEFIKIGNNDKLVSKLTRSTNYLEVMSYLKYMDEG